MNEPARPAAARPVLSESCRFLVHISTRSRLVPGRAIRVCVRRPLYIPTRPCNRLPLRVLRVLYLDHRGNTRPRRPRAGRLPARHAHACHAPSDSTRIARHPCHAPSLSSQLLTLWLERGMYRGLGCASARRARHRPHSSGTRNSLPSHLRLWRERLRRKQCPDQLFGSAAKCTFPFPPFRFCHLCYSALRAKSTS